MRAFLVAVGATVVTAHVGDHMVRGAAVDCGGPVSPFLQELAQSPEACLSSAVPPLSLLSVSLLSFI